jgi:hypothetical protein
MRENTDHCRSEQEGMHIRQIESLTMMSPHFSRHVEWADIYILDTYYCTCDGRFKSVRENADHCK